MMKFELCDMVEVVNGNVEFVGKVGKILLVVKTEEGRYMVGFEDNTFKFFDTKDLKLLKKYYEL